MTKEQLKAAMGCTEGNAQKNIDAFNLVCERYEINTPVRQAAFIAHVGCESNSFNSMRENLNYDAAGLIRIFRKHFTDDEAALYAHQPERIANRVYANRMGNGPEESGDGWNFRGGGWLQMTGKADMQAFALETGINIIQDPSLIDDPKAAAMMAGWEWDKKNANRLADTMDFEGLTRAINGGLNGFEDRKKRWAVARAALGC